MVFEGKRLWVLASGSALVGIAGMFACVAEDPGDLSTPDAATQEAAAPNLCNDYCSAVLTKCTGDNNAAFSNEATCLQACNLMVQGKSGDTNINTVGCRLPFAQVGGTIDNCRAASAYGGNHCQEPCITFCDLVEEQCIKPLGAAFTQYPDKGTCTEQCRSQLMPKYDAGGIEGSQQKIEPDTLNCRMYHLLLSLGSDGARKTHCGHVGLDSPVCKTIKDAGADGG
jgi:hypothetical protein